MGNTDLRGLRRLVMDNTDLRGLRRLTQIKIREIREILLNP